MLTRESILSANDLPTETVSVPEWGGEVRVRTMTAAERDDFELALVDLNGKKTPENIRSKLLVRCLVGEDGERMFSGADLAALGGKSSAALTRLFRVARRLNGIGEDAAIEKNSDGGDADTSTSSSPES